LVIISDLSQCAATGAIVSGDKEKAIFLRRKRPESPEPAQGAKKGKSRFLILEIGFLGELARRGAQAARILKPLKTGRAHFKAGFCTRGGVGAHFKARGQGLRRGFGGNC
jgi:hypothetical protein